MPLFSFFKPKPETKSSRAAPLTALHFFNRATWSSRDMKTLARAGFEQNPVAYRAMRLPALRRMGGILLVLLLIQVTLGIVNVVGNLPLPVAVAHNGTAALLLAVLVMLNFATRSPSPFSR